MAMQGTFGAGGEVVFNLKIDTSGAENEVNRLLDGFKDLEQIALRYLALANRMGLPEDVTDTINKIARLIVLIRQAQFALELFYASMIPGAGIIKQVGAIGAIALTGVSAVDTIGSFV
jgi:hypothetical protein